MSGYCCLEFRKIKSTGQMKAAYAHNFRENYVANADITRRDLNKEIVELNGYSYTEYFDEYMKDLAAYGCQKNVRKNAVLGYELVLTFSREERERINIDEWEKANVKWLNEHFNSRGIQKSDGSVVESRNIASVVRHDDEAGNIHLHAIVIPVDEKGKLNGSAFIDGKDTFYEMHNSYAKAMEPFELKRGEYYSTAIHKNIKEFYTAINKIEETSLPEPLPGETVEKYRERAEGIYKDSQRQWFDKHLKLERQRDNIKTFSIQKEVEFNNKKKNLHREMKKLADGFNLDVNDDTFTERVREIRHEIKETRDFKTALESYPDREKAETARLLYEEMVKWNQETRRNERKRKKREDVLTLEENNVLERMGTHI